MVRYASWNLSKWLKLTSDFEKSSKFLCNALLVFVTLELQYKVKLRTNLSNLLLILFFVLEVIEDLVNQ